MKRRKSGNSRGIAYQNKDVLSKVFADRMPDKSFRVYGIDIPKVVRALPTNLPAVEANKLRIDNLFLLEDDTVAIVDYESTYQRKSKLKYLNYIQRVLRRYFEENHEFVQLRMIVIYTADVKPHETEAGLDVGCLHFLAQEAFLSEIDSESVTERINRKVKNGELLTEEEMMEFIILPLTYQGKKAQEKSIHHAVHLAEEIEDEEVQTFLLAGLLVFADKVIDQEAAEEVRRCIYMTKIGRLIAKEIEEAVEKAERDTAKETARQMFFDGMELSKVKRYVYLSDEELCYNSWPNR